MTYVYLILSGLAVAAGDYYSKLWATSGGTRLLLCVIGAYIVSTGLWLPVIARRNELALMGTLWSVICLLMAVIIGTLVFHEKLSPANWTGIIFALAATVLLSVK
jgi:multidrug transporter EmrE-like cation transporter